MGLDFFINVKNCDVGEMSGIARRLYSVEIPEIKTALEGYKNIQPGSRIQCKDVDNIVYALHKHESENLDLRRIRQKLLTMQGKIQLGIAIFVFFDGQGSEVHRIIEGKDYSSEDDIKLLLEIYNKILEKGMEPNIFLANKICTFYKKTGKFNEALAFAKSIPEHRKSNSFINTVASCLNKFERWQEAIDEIDKIPPEEQNSYVVHTKAISLIGLGKIEEARKSILRIPPKDLLKNQLVLNLFTKLSATLRAQDKI